MTDHISLGPRPQEHMMSTPIEVQICDKYKLAPIMFNDRSSSPVRISGVHYWESSDEVEIGWSENEFALTQTCMLSSTPSPLSISINLSPKTSSPIVVEIPADEQTGTFDEIKEEEIKEEEVKSKGKMRSPVLVTTNDAKNGMSQLSQLLHYNNIETALPRSTNPGIRRTASSDLHPQRKAQKLRTRMLPVSKEIDRLCYELFECARPDRLIIVEMCVNGILEYSAQKLKMQYLPISGDALSWICGLRTGLRPESDDASDRLLWIMLAINSACKDDDLSVLSSMVRHAFYQHGRQPIPSIVQVPLSDPEWDAVNDLHEQLTEFFAAVVYVRPELLHAVDESCGCSLCDRQWTHTMSFGSY